MLTKDIFEVFILAIILSIDGLLTGISYGISKIKLNIIKCIFISLLSSVVLAVSIGIGSLFSSFISTYVCNLISFILLFLIGFIKLVLDLKSIYHKKHSREKNNKKNIIGTFIDSKCADIDKNNIISFFEAIVLGISLSVDSFAVGLSVGIVNMSCLLFIIFSLLLNFLALFGGDLLGKLISKNINLNLSWFCGLALMLLAIFRFIL